MPVFPTETGLFAVCFQRKNYFYKKKMDSQLSIFLTISLLQSPKQFLLKYRRIMNGEP